MSQQARSSFGADTAWLLSLSQWSPLSRFSSLFSPCQRPAKLESKPDKVLALDRTRSRRDCRRGEAIETQVGKVAWGSPRNAGCGTTNAADERQDFNIGAMDFGR